MRALHPLKALLTATSMPVWLTVLLAVAGISGGLAGTYYFLPTVNYRIEVEKIKSQYLSANLLSLSTDTSELLAWVGQINRGLMTTNKIDPALEDRVYQRISRLQWKALELDVVFRSAKDRQTLEVYRDALDRLRLSIEKVDGLASVQEILASSESFARSSRSVVVSLAVRAGLL